MNTRLKQLKSTSEVYGQLSSASVAEIFAEVKRLTGQRKELSKQLTDKCDELKAQSSEGSILLTAIAEIAGQKLSKEMEMPNHADYQFAYEEIIRVARIASDRVSGTQS